MTQRKTALKKKKELPAVEDISWLKTRMKSPAAERVSIGENILTVEIEKAITCRGI